MHLEPILNLRRHALAVCLALALGAPPECVAADSRAGARPAFAATHAAIAPTPPRARSIEGGLIVVQNCDDSGSGSLREAYFSALDGSTIDLTQLQCGTITLTTGALTDSPSAADITLQGPGKDALTIDAGYGSRVLVHNGSGVLDLSGLTITRGSYSGTYGGGCIYSYGDVYLRSSIVSACSMSSSGTGKAYGGAVYAQGHAGILGSAVIGSSAYAAAAHSGGGGVWASSVRIQASTISGNTASGDGSHYARGGGVFALGDAAILYSTIAGNEAINGGGLYLAGAANQTMQIVNSTISGNHAFGAGGGVFAKYRPLEIANSTVAQNTAGFEIGAGLYLAFDTELQSSIVANNTAQDGLLASDIGGPATTDLSGANNLIVASTRPFPADTIVADPLLGPLQDNGGFTFTQALLQGSPAIDHGNNTLNLFYDQRVLDGIVVGLASPTGTAELIVYERRVGPSVDIGAFEFGAPDLIFADRFGN